MKHNSDNRGGRPEAMIYAIRTRFMVIAITLVLLAMLTNIVLTTRLAARVDARPVCPEPPRYLPCGALPLRLIHEDPECANTLLRIMNVTNVHILPHGSELRTLDSETAAQLRILCPQFANRSMPLPAACRHLAPNGTEARGVSDGQDD